MYLLPQIPNLILKKPLKTQKMCSQLLMKRTSPKGMLDFEYSVTSNTHNKTTHSDRLYCGRPAPLLTPVCFVTGCSLLI